MHWRLALGGLVLLTFVGASSSAEAQEQKLPVAVEYQAIEGCPSEDAFWDALSSRAPRVERAEVSQALATLRISVIVTPQGVLGRLQIVRRDLTTEPRFVEAASCDEVVQALALTAALSVEGEVAPHAAEPTPPPSPPPPLRPPPEDSPYTDRRLPIDYVESPTVSGHDDWETEVNGYGIAAFVVDQNASLGVGGAITFARKRQVLATQMLGLGVAGLSTALTNDESRTRFTLTQAEFMGCPTAWGRSVVVRPCLLFQVGILNGSGVDISNPENAQDMWWAPGASLRLEAPAHGLVRLQVALHAVVPLTPRTYTLGEPHSEVAKTMSVSPWLTVGVSLAP